MRPLRTCAALRWPASSSCDCANLFSKEAYEHSGIRRPHLFASATGRTVCIPTILGGRGACYLMSAQQRASRAWLQLGFYALALAALWFVPAVTASTQHLVAFAFAFALFNYLLYWLFSIGLPTTEKPPRPTPEQRRTAMAAHSRSLGRPVLWVFLVISCLFVFAGGVMALLLGEWFTGVLCGLFFGLCAANFAWQLRLVAGGSDT